MEYQKIINLLNNTTNQPSKFRTRVEVEKNDESKGRYDNSNIGFKKGHVYVIIAIHSYLLKEL